MQACCTAQHGQRTVVSGAGRVHGDRAHPPSPATPDVLGVPCTVAMVPLAKTRRNDIILRRMGKEGGGGGKQLIELLNEVKICRVEQNIRQCP